MSPAPSVRTTSPSRTRARSSAGACRQSAQNSTPRCPEARAAATINSPETPGIGDSREG